MAKVKKTVKKSSPKTSKKKSKKTQLVHIDVKDHNQKFLDSIKEYNEKTLVDPKDFKCLGYVTIAQIGEEWFKLTKNTIITKNHENYYIMNGRRVDKIVWDREEKMKILLGLS